LQLIIEMLTEVLINYTFIDVLFLFLDSSGIDIP